MDTTQTCPVYNGSAEFAMRYWFKQHALANVKLLAAGGGVYDGTVPPGKDVRMPYAVVGEYTENGMDAQNRRGVMATMTLHIWSNYRGSAEAAILASRIISLTVRKKWAGGGWNIAETWLDLNSTLIEADESRHTVIRIRAQIHNLGWPEEED